MLTHEENMLVTRTGPGTPMGEAMRRYWIPALLSTELPESDCPPVRVQLLGEKLVAFRDTQGRIGLLDEFCPHRLVSLWLGRNEESGLRCVYHGWKFDVNGACVEQMNEPQSAASPTKSVPRPTPRLNWAGSSGPTWDPRPKCRHRHILSGRICPRAIVMSQKSSRSATGCRPWKAASTPRMRPSCIVTFPPPLPGRGFLSRVHLSRAGHRRWKLIPPTMGTAMLGCDRCGTARPTCAPTILSCPLRKIRPQQFRMPGERVRPRAAGHFWVPMDDENCMVWNWMYSFGDEPLTEEDRLERGSGNGPDHVDQTTFRSFRHKGNNWLIDRQVQKTETYTGIDGINTQDRGVQESMGPIVDRSREHLGPADRAIIVARRLLLQAVKTVQEGGDPLGADTSYYNARAVEQILPQGVAWRDALLSEMYPASEPLAAAD